MPASATLFIFRVSYILTRLDEFYTVVVSPIYLESIVPNADQITDVENFRFSISRHIFYRKSVENQLFQFDFFLKVLPQSVEQFSLWPFCRGSIMLAYGTRKKVGVKIFGKKRSMNQRILPYSVGSAPIRLKLSESSGNRGGKRLAKFHVRRCIYNRFR